MKSKILICFFFFCFFSLVLFAQQFSRINNIPVYKNGVQLRNPWAGGLNHPLFSEIDLNGDGIKDLFVFDKSNARIECFINQGTADSVNYIFSSSYYNSFPFLHDWVLLYDYNCDGKADIFAFSDNTFGTRGIKVYENISSGGNLQFRLVSPLLTTMNGSRIDTIPINSFAYPALIDVDNDGDMDILDLTNQQPRTAEYNKNMSEENGWGCDSLKFHYETGCWGNFAFTIGPNTVGYWNYCSAGGAARTSGLGLGFDYDAERIARVDDSVTNIFAFDETGNGTKDLLIGDIASNNSLLIVNGGTPEAANMISQDASFPSYDVPIYLPGFTNQAYLDVNNDNKKDLIISCSNVSNINCVLYYKNISSTGAPKFSFQENEFLQGGMIDVGEGCYPVFFDYNNDGLMDIVIGNNFYSPKLGGVIGTSLALYQNIGTATSPAFELIDSDFANIAELGGLGGPIYPAFGDLNGDGKPDLILGIGNGTLIYFINNAPAGQPASFQYDTATYKGIHVSGNATPQLIDLDRDGLLDLVIGSRDGYLRYYRNIGTVNAANFSSVPTIDSLGKANTHNSIDFSGYSVPFIYDSSGSFQMYLAGEEGYILHYNNIDNNLNGAFNLIDTVINGSEGQQLSVAGTDLNNDGKIDLIIGNYAGGAGIFSQNLPLSVPTFNDVKPSFELSPNPATTVLTAIIHNLKENNARLNIVDMLGRNVKTIAVNSTTINLDISYLSGGIYLIELQTEKFNVTRKLIIQR